MKPSIHIATSQPLIGQDLQQLGDLQRAAAASNSSSGLTWQQYERHAEQQLAKLEAELPMATAEAAHLQARCLCILPNRIPSLNMTVCCNRKHVPRSGNHVCMQECQGRLIQTCCAWQAAAKAAAQQEVSSRGMAAAAPPIPETLASSGLAQPPLPDQGPQPPPDDPAPPPDQQPALPPDGQRLPQPAGQPALPPDEQPPAPAPDESTDAAMPDVPASQAGGSAPTAANGTHHKQDMAAGAAGSVEGAAAGAGADTLQGGTGLEEGELPAMDQPGGAVGTGPPPVPAAGVADDSMDMDVDDVPQFDAPAAPAAESAPAQPPATPQPPAAAPAAAGAATAAATPAEAATAAAAALPPTGGAPGTPAAGAAAHPGAPVAWPMPIGGPMAMPFTWSLYYPPPAYPPMHAFSAAHGPHTLPHPAMFPHPDPLHLAHTSAPFRWLP